MTEEQIPYEDTQAVAAETFVHDLMEICLQEVKAMPKSWQELNQQQQDDVIGRIDRACRAAGRKAVRTLVAEGKSSIRVTIDKIVIGDKGIQATISTPKHAPDRHDFFDCQGMEANLVVHYGQEATEAPHAHKGEAEQRDLIDGSVVTGDEEPAPHTDTDAQSNTPDPDGTQEEAEPEVDADAGGESDPLSFLPLEDSLPADAQQGAQAPPPPPEEVDDFTDEDAEEALAKLE